jgi:ubiquinone/menaquinone biosynthesis C-methylase UbiE
MSRTIDEVRARFDRVAAEWDSNPTRVNLARAVVDAIRSAVPLSPSLRGMDFGAGTGLVTLGLLPHVASLTAVDASPEMLRVLDQKLQALGIGNVFTLACDIARAPLPTAQFDLIVSSMTLHHLPDVPGVLRRLRPSLRPGGWIALADLDAEDGSFHADMTGVYHRGFARTQIQDWLGEAGFTDAALRDAHRISRPGADGRERTYGVFLATARVA